MNVLHVVSYKSLNGVYLILFLYDMCCDQHYQVFLTHILPWHLQTVQMVCIKYAFVLMHKHSCVHVRHAFMKPDIVKHRVEYILGWVVVFDTKL